MTLQNRTAATRCAAALLLSALAGPLAWGQTGGSKTELAQKIVQMQQPAFEAMARQLAEMPAAQLLQQAGPALQQRVPADKREAVGQEIQGDARRYAEEAVPIVRDRAVKLAPELLVPLLESKLSEDELRQVLQVLQQIETPAFRKYNALAPDMQRTLTERVVADTRAQIEPKMKTLQDSVTKRLGGPAKPAAGAGSGAAPKK